MYAKDFHRVFIGLPLVWLAKDAGQQEKGGGKVEEGHPDDHHNCDGGDCDGEMMIGRRESSREQFGRRTQEKKKVRQTGPCRKEKHYKNKTKPTENKRYSKKKIFLK